jgi:RNA polymerase sigma factor (sigma-70 family)
MFTDQNLEFIQPRIRKYVYSVVYDHKNAEDIVQNVNLILIKKRNEYDDSKSFSGWAMTITRFQIKRYLTDRKRWNNKFINFQHKDFPAIEDPFHHLIQDEKIKLDLEIQNYLPDKQYKIYKRLREGFSVKEISKELSIKPNNISRLKGSMIKKMKLFFKDKNEKIKQYSKNF